MHDHHELENSADAFDVESFRQLVQSHWRYLSPSNIIQWAAIQREDGIWQISAAPTFQEIYGGPGDGKQTWSAFEFDAAGFLAEPGLEVEVLGVMTYQQATSTLPFLGMVGLYFGSRFVLKVNLEPLPETEPSEIWDALRNEVRSILP